jgi:thiol:disulfide interchange protein
MKGTIRIFLGMALLICAGSVNDTLPTADFIMLSLGLGIPGALIAFWGTTAANADLS